MDIYKYIKKFNETVALNITLSMGTIWCVYAFFILAMLPLVFPNLTNIVEYLSSTIIQLTALPAIMVGQQILGRTAELREQQDHETILAEFAETKELHRHMDEVIEDLVKEFAETKEMHEHINVLITSEMTDAADLKELHDHMHRISEKVLSNLEVIQNINIQTQKTAEEVNEIKILLNLQNRN